MTRGAAAAGRAGVWPALWRAGSRLLRVFGVGFYGAHALTAAQGFRLPVHMGWELSIPWWPLAYPLPAPTLASAWADWAQWARAVAGHHNLLPSLHAALSAITLATVWHWVRPPTRAVLGLIWRLQALAVLLTHQHPVRDALAGAAVARAVWRRPGPPG